MNRAEAIETAARLRAANVILYGHRIGVVADEADETTRAGIIIPDEAKKKPIRGRVVLLGTHVDTTNPEDVAHGLCIGDHITFTKYHGTLFDIDPGDGQGELHVEAFHSADLYIGWPG